MSSPVIAPPDNFQLQSPLLRLPPEIKHMIYALCFVTDCSLLDPIADPSMRTLKKEKNGSKGISIPGSNLLQTCRRVYHEADRRPLFTENSFRFTSVDRVRTFLKSLDGDLSTYVQDIEIDIRRVHSDHPDRAREWLHYLAWGNGSWAQSLASLRRDAVGLKCLRLNFESWPRVPMFRTELWDLLRSMLSRLEGLDRIVVTGASKGSNMARKAPWSSVHFVGGDDVGPDDLVPRLWSAVQGSDETKVIRWVRKSGKIHLEVVSTAYLLKCVDGNWSIPSSRSSHTDAWPESGSCTIFGYENRNSEDAELRTKEINPIVFE